MLLLYFCAVRCRHCLLFELKGSIWVRVVRAIQPVFEFLNMSPEAVTSETSVCSHPVAYPLACMAQYIFLKSCSIMDNKSCIGQQQVSSHTFASSDVLYSFKMCALMFILLWTRPNTNKTLFSYFGSNYIACPCSI